MTKEQDIQTETDRITALFQDELEKLVPVDTPLNEVDTEKVSAELLRKFLASAPYVEGAEAEVRQDPDDPKLYHFTYSLPGTRIAKYRLVPKTEEAKKALRELAEELGNDQV